MILANGTFNKSLAGYHILMILAELDGKVSEKQLKVITEYTKLNFDFLTNLNQETILLNNLPKALYKEHFYKVATDFYVQSNHEERVKFLDFVMKVILSDKLVSKKENYFLNELFNLWDLDIE
jgi:uncharacterized tellurite resistance protein B-like protein